MAGDKKRPGSAPDKKKKKSIEIPFGYESVMNAPLGKPLTSPKLKKRLIQRREKTIKTIPKRKVRKNNFVDIVDKTEVENSVRFKAGSGGPKREDRSRAVYNSIGIQQQSTRKTDPIIGFKLSDKKPLNDAQKDDVPGPGSYKPPTCIGGYQPDSTVQSAPEITLAGREVFGGTVNYTEAKNTPGPLDYPQKNPNVSTKEKRAPHYSLTARNYVRTEADKIPGPAQYLGVDMGPRLDKVRPRCGFPIGLGLGDRDKCSVYIAENKRRGAYAVGPGEYGVGVEFPVRGETQSSNQFESRYKGPVVCALNKAHRDHPPVDPVALAAIYSCSPGAALHYRSCDKQVLSTKRSAPKASISGRNWFGDTNNVSELFSRLGKQESLTGLRKYRPSRAPR